MEAKNSLDRCAAAPADCSTNLLPIYSDAPAWERGAVCLTRPAYVSTYYPVAWPDCAPSVEARR